MREIEIIMPNPGAFACCPSGDCEYDDAFNEAVRKGIPEGYELVGKIQDVQSRVRAVIQHIAIIKVREKEWKGIPSKDRTLWFGIANEGMDAPWMNAFGACLVKIWDIRRREDGVIEYGIGNETRPDNDKMGWVTGNKFYSEWPQ